MILVGSSRGGARDLAAHLLKDDNDHVEVYELRGFASQDLKSAFSEIHAISKGTKCRQFMFSLSMNPPQEEAVGVEIFLDAMDKVERRLGLIDQPRAIVFHEKEGRRHAHVVWSRIKADELKAIHLPFSKRNLNEIGKNLYLDHDWRLPPGLTDPSLSNPLNFTRAEWEQAKRSNKDPREIKQVFQTAWLASDSRSAFEAALEDKGYRLARGRKSFVAVDVHGEVYSIARQSKVKVRDLKDRLGDPSGLPDVQEVQRQFRAQMAERLEFLKKEVSQESAKQAADIRMRHSALVQRQRDERESLFAAQEKRWIEETRNRQARFRSGLKGLWDRLRGEYRRIAAQNTQESRVAQTRDRLERNNLSIRHRSEKRALRSQVTLLRTRYASQRQNLKLDIAQFQTLQHKTGMEPS